MWGDERGVEVSCFLRPSAYLIPRISKMEIRHTDCLVIGSGLAGSAYAFHAGRQGHSCIVLAAAHSASQTNSDWAQGGIIYDLDLDHASLAADIQAASDNTSNPEAIETIATHGPAAVKSLLIDELGVAFDRDSDGGLKFTREGGHSKKRIIFHKDITGHGILEAMHRRLATVPGVEVLTDSTAIDLITLSHSSRNPLHRFAPLTCTGAYVHDGRTGQVYAILAKKTVLATGGLGQIFLHTTNQQGMVGHGVAMAYRVGARVMDLEYVQFHPTTFFRKGVQSFLISETVRGEGAVLVNAAGQPFMEGQHPLGSLAPRDVVARAIHSEMARSGDPCVYLDLKAMKPDFIRERFPTIYARCLEAGVDITREPIPVVPAAHYLCGGVWTDLQGRTSVKNLSAVGETACTGLHGANRLASTSLLECIVFGQLAAEADSKDIRSSNFTMPDVRPWVSPTNQADPVLIAQDLGLIRRTLWNYVGLIRSPRRLQRARRILLELREEISQFYANYHPSPALIELRNAVQTALLVVHAASLNPVSKGSHFVAPDE